MRESYDNLEIVSETGTIPNVPVLNIKEKILGKKFNLNLIYCSPKKSRELNKTYRDKDYPTNILTFPLSESEGEIYICRSVARAGYKEFDMSYAKFLTLLVVHGMLHLKGVDHGETMEKLEHDYTEKFYK